MIDRALASSSACALPGTGTGGLLGPLVVTAPLEEAAG